MFSLRFQSARTEAATRKRVPLPGPAFRRSKITVIVAAIFFLYVGSEAGIGGWAAEHVKRLEGHATALTTMSPLFFYAGIDGGARVSHRLLLPRIGSLRFIITAFSLAIVGIAMIIYAHSTQLAIAGFTIAGLGLRDDLSDLYFVVLALVRAGGAAIGWSCFLDGVVGRLGAALARRVCFDEGEQFADRIFVPLAGILMMAVLVTFLRKRGLQML